jgi:hypothetical protein
VPLVKRNALHTGSVTHSCPQTDILSSVVVSMTWKGGHMETFLSAFKTTLSIDTNGCATGRQNEYK